MMKGLTMAQWINLNQNNISVVAYQYSVLLEKTGPTFLLLVGLIAGLQVNEIRMYFQFLKFATN